MEGRGRSVIGYVCGVSVKVGERGRSPTGYVCLGRCHIVGKELGLMLQEMEDDGEVS